MRILFVGNQYQKAAGARSFGFTQRFYNGLVRAGHFVHFFADKDEARTLAPLGLFKQQGAEKANCKFLNTLEHIKPHAIIFAHRGLITPETLATVRQKHPDIRIAYLNVDALFSPTNRRNIERMRDYSDAIFITTDGPVLASLAAPSCPLYYIPSPTDTSIDTGRAFAQEQPAYDVAAIMHGDHNEASDQQARLFLAARVGEINGIRTCYRGFGGHPAVYGYDYLDVLSRSAMTLCLNRHACDGMESTTETRYRYSSDRTSHVMGNGSLAILSADFALQSLYTEEEAVFFATAEELVEKVTFYKNNPTARQKIARNGWEKSHREFNEETVMRYVMERLFDQPLSQNYTWVHMTANIAPQTAA